MGRRWSVGLVFGLVLQFVSAPAIAGPEPGATLDSANTVLNEIMAIPSSQIPGKLLQEAQGVAIIPSVVKIGFVAGVRRGHGVVLVKDADGDWGLPTFCTLTGGSFGWQAGAQASDVILVFKTRRSVENLMRGKFTLGGDAAVSAGPIGRNVAAATDASFQAEILSYSRSRGLFAGVALDGSAIQMDAADHQAYYGATPREVPARVPPGATRLVETLARYSGAPAAGAAPTAVPVNDVRLDKLRQDLTQSITQLNRLVDENWQSFLALPADIFQRDRLPNPATLQDTVAKYKKISESPEYQALGKRPEFTQTYQQLVELQKLVSESSGAIALPPPPPPGPPTATGTLPPRR